MDSTNWELNLGGLPPVGVEILGSSDIGAPGADREVRGNARNGEVLELPELNQELKKIKKQLKQMIDLQKQANFMAGGFIVVSLLCFYFTC